MSTKKKRVADDEALEVEDNEDNTTDDDEDEDEVKPKKKRTRNEWTKAELKSMWALIKEHHGDLGEVIRLSKFNHPRGSVRKKGLALLKRYSKEESEKKEKEQGKGDSEKETEKKKETKAETEQKDEDAESEAQRTFAERLKSVPPIDVKPQSKDDFSEDYSQTFKPVVLVNGSRLNVIFPDLGERVVMEFLFTETYVGVNMLFVPLPSDQNLIRSLGFPDSKQLVFPPAYLKYSFGDYRINAAEESIRVERKEDAIIASAPIIKQKSSIVRMPKRQLTTDQSQPHELPKEEKAFTPSSTSDSPITATIHSETNKF